MEALAQVVRDAGGTMSFPAFVAAARSAGLNPQFWLRAKHAGLLETRIDDEGNHIVSVPVAQPEGGQ